SQGKGKVRQTVVKRTPWKEEPSKGKSKGKGKGDGGGRWVWVEETPRRPAPSGKGGKVGGGKGTKGKGTKGNGAKGKGKGNMRAAPVKSQFWQKKVESEGRKELGDSAHPGVIFRYNIKQGWGFIKPDNMSGLPAQVRKKMSEAESAAEESGKEVKEKGLLYFRKPDVNHTDGFKLSTEVPVTFRVYVDDKGAGAMDVSMA
ncbi:unnamed protein product, partial [Effrenium voratum]